MSLKEKLEIELLDARKHKNLYKKEVLQLIKADIQNVEIKNKKELSDEDVISLLNKQKKQIEDSKNWAEKANRTDLIEESIVKLQVVWNILVEVRQLRYHTGMKRPIWLDIRIKR